MEGTKPEVTCLQLDKIIDLLCRTNYHRASLIASVRVALACATLSSLFGKQRLLFPSGHSKPSSLPSKREGERERPASLAQCVRCKSVLKRLPLRQVTRRERFLYLPRLERASPTHTHHQFLVRDREKRPKRYQTRCGSSKG